MLLCTPYVYDTTSTSTTLADNKTLLKTGEATITVVSLELIVKSRPINGDANQITLRIHRKHNTCTYIMDQRVLQHILLITICHHAV